MATWRRFLRMAAAGAGVEAGAAPPRAAHRLGQHHHADQRDQAVAHQAHACDLGHDAAERLTQQEIRQRDHDQRRDDVADRDLDAHQQTAPDAGLAREKVGGHHELAVARAERMHDAVGEGERHPDQQRQRARAVADRLHVPGDQAVGLALEGEQRAPDRGDRAPGRLDGGGLVLRRRRLAGERVGGPARLQGEAEQQADGEQPASQAYHQLVAQLSVIASG